MELFDLADVNGDGDVDVTELNQALKLVGIENKVERTNALKSLIQVCLFGLYMHVNNPCPL